MKHAWLRWACMGKGWGGGGGGWGGKTKHVVCGEHFKA